MVSLSQVIREVEQKHPTVAKIRKGAGVAAVIGVCFVAGFGLRYLYQNVGEEVYRGDISGYSVVYEEDAPNLTNRSSDFFNNLMVVRKGDVTYLLQDFDSETNIDWKNEHAPDFGNDLLERVVVTIGDSSREYFSSRAGDSTIDGIAARTVFEQANRLYNSLRKDIRKELRQGYTAGQAPFVGSFSK